MDCVWFETIGGLDASILSHSGTETFGMRRQDSAMVNAPAPVKPFKSGIALVATNCYDYAAFPSRETVDKGPAYGGQENRADSFER